MLLWACIEEGLRETGDQTRREQLLENWFAFFLRWLHDGFASFSKQDWRLAVASVEHEACNVVKGICKNPDER